MILKNGWTHQIMMKQEEKDQAPSLDPAPRCPLSLGNKQRSNMFYEQWERW